MLTFPESVAVQPVMVHRVVDGQQRLTTVSILLACIAEALGPEGQSGDWTARTIRNDWLTNPEKPPNRFRKLRLQDGDEEEYRSGLEGNPHGPGAVAQAWRIARRLVRTQVTWVWVSSSRDSSDFVWSASGSGSAMIPNRSSRASTRRDGR